MGLDRTAEFFRGAVVGDRSRIALLLTRTSANQRLMAPSISLTPALHSPSYARIITNQEILMRLSLLALPVLLVLPLCGEVQDPLRLVQKAAANYAGLLKTTYDFEQTELLELNSSSRSQTPGRQWIVGSRGRYREESLSSGTLYVFDGKHNWAYSPGRNEYTKTSARSAHRLATSLIGFEIAGHRAKSARFLRVEDVNLASGPVACQVIEVEREAVDDRMGKSLTTYWIDAKRRLFLKARISYPARAVDGSASSSEKATTVSFSKANVGRPVDESLFRFTPPAGAVLVERLTFGPK